MEMGKKLLVEAVGTFWLVLGGCGSAVLAAKYGFAEGKPFIGIGLVGIITHQHCQQRGTPADLAA